MEEEKNNSLTTVPKSDAGKSELQMLPIKSVKEWYNGMVNMATDILKKDQDFGVIPGVKKKSLLKPGAEKLKVAFNLSAVYENVYETIDFQNGYYDVCYKCIVKTMSGHVLAECTGSVNSLESKYRFTWQVREIPKDDKGKQDDVKIDKMKMDGTGKWTKNEYTKKYEWKEKVERDIKTILSDKNTMQKMAQKRAFVGAMLTATGASEFFTQDVEDMEIKPVENVNEDKPEPKKETKPVVYDYPTFSEYIKASKTLISLQKIAAVIGKQKAKFTESDYDKLVKEGNDKKAELEKLPDIKTGNDNPYNLINQSAKITLEAIYKSVTKDNPKLAEDPVFKKLYEKKKAEFGLLNPDDVVPESNYEKAVTQNGVFPIDTGDIYNKFIKKLQNNINTQQLDAYYDEIKSDAKYKKLDDSQKEALEKTYKAEFNKLK